MSSSSPANEDEDDDEFGMPPAPDAAEFTLYSNKKGRPLHHAYSEDDDNTVCYVEEVTLERDAADFLYPFLCEYRGDLFNQLMHEEAVDMFEDEDANPDFVRECLNQIGAPKSWKGNKARVELLNWVRMPHGERPFAYKTVPQMKVIAEENGFNLPTNVRKDAYRKSLAAAFAGGSAGGTGDAGDEEQQPEDIKSALMRAMLEGSFKQKLKKGRGEGQSKATLMGQRLERTVLETFWLANEKMGDKCGNFESLYQPGLVQQRNRPYVRDSSDGVIIERKPNGEMTATPVEVKARVNPDTYQRTINRFYRKHSLGGSEHDIRDLPGLGDDTCKMKFYDISSDNTLLRGFVPESHDRFQFMHHTYTFGADSCFYLISSTSQLMYALRIRFKSELLEAYGDVLKWLHDQVLKPFWVEGSNVPDVWTPEVEKAFSSRKLKSLKMNQHAFQSYVGLWRGINVDIKIPRPVAPAARILSLSHSYYNATKGGGDTITKFDDICQERMPVRTEVTVASSRVLVNSGVVTHRNIQMITSKSPEWYPTLAHLRNAASKRSTVRKSFKTLSHRLLKRCEKEATKNVVSDGPFLLANSCPTPSVRPARRSGRNLPTTPFIRLPCVAGVSGDTPGRGKSVTKPSVEYLSRCRECSGTFPAKRVLSIDEKGDTRAGADDRRDCSVCKRQTQNFCNGCRRYLCDNSPLSSKDRNKKVYPKHFKMRVPEMAADGSCKRDEEDKIVFRYEYGILTCYHIAHQEVWKEKFGMPPRPNEVLSTIAEEEEEEVTPGKKRRKK